MSPHDPPEHRGPRRTRNPSESERLYRRRLQEVLGINAPGIEVILRLRNRMIVLQTRMRQLEADLVMREAGQRTRLMQHREACFEASWQEVVDPEEQL